MEVTLVELKVIELPDSMKRAMARQAEAERESVQDHQRRGGGDGSFPAPLMSTIEELGSFLTREERAGGRHRQE